MNNPCAFAPSVRQARHAARFYARMFEPGSTVLDLGFGQGYFLEEARLAGLQAIGLDRSSRLVAEATARGLTAIQANVTNLLDVLEEPLDGVLAAHLIEHLPPEQVGSLLRDLARVVKPAGIAVFATPNTRDWRVITELFWMDPTHIRPYPPEALRQLSDPDSWIWDAAGLEPMVITRHTPLELINRLRYGLEYGRSGRWYRLRRTLGQS